MMEMRTFLKSLKFWEPYDISELDDDTYVYTGPENGYQPK